MLFCYNYDSSSDNLCSFSRRRGIFWTACREYQGCIGSGDCTFLYQYVWLYLFWGRSIEGGCFSYGIPNEAPSCFCIFRSGYLFFCNHTISIGRTACQCVFYDKRWDSGNDRYGSIACKSDHVHVSGNFHRCVCNSGISKNIFKFQCHM